MPRHILIDGYNLAYASPGIRAALLADKQKGRERLIDLLRRYKKISGARITEVFDSGEDSPREKDAPASGITVIYSRPPLNADEELRKMLNAASDRGNILLVSGDRAVAHSAKRRNIASISSSEFLLKVQQLLSQRGEAGEKPDTVDVGEWEAFFRITKDGDDSEK